MCTSIKAHKMSAIQTKLTNLKEEKVLLFTIIKKQAKDYKMQHTCIQLYYPILLVLWVNLLLLTFNRLYTKIIGQ